MNDEPEARARPAQDERTDLAVQMERLEAYVADARARGEEIPPEAALMIARLRELIGALDDLTQSIKRGGQS